MSSASDKNNTQTDAVMISIPPLAAEDGGGIGTTSTAAVESATGTKSFQMRALVYTDIYIYIYICIIL
jgi:hypothetical protein